MSTISLKVPDELIARMDAVARAKRTSRSALLREALEEKAQGRCPQSPTKSIRAKRGSMRKRMQRAG